MLAAAKINLDLHITGRREDGYHLLDSLVVFTDYGDEIEAELSNELSLEITGPFSNGLESGAGNLILKAARLICGEAGVRPNIKFKLTKNLPVSSGIGGGSADAAAAIRLCVEVFSLKIDADRLNELALSLGADVPVCLNSKAVHMSGIGEKMSTLNLTSKYYMLLVNPGISVSTPEVFEKYKKLNCNFDAERKFSTEEIHFPFMIDRLKESKNSLQAAALTLELEIKDVLDALGQTDDLLIFRMSGSGATCFGLYENDEQCKKAARTLIGKHPDWWIKPVEFQ